MVPELMPLVCGLMTAIRAGRDRGRAMPKRSTLRLTKRIVERLKADDKDAIFWDRDLPGFGVRVHATGRKLYIV